MENDRITSEDRLKYSPQYVREKVLKFFLILIVILITGYTLSKYYQDWQNSQAYRKQEVMKAYQHANDIPNYQITITKL